MRRTAEVAAAAVIALMLVPTSAWAADGGESASAALRLGVSLLGLIVAIVLLLEALAVRKVAFGGALAEKISYVVLAIVCLACSALAQWLQNFVPAVPAFTLQQVQLASQALVIVAMGLLAAYFYSVRSALQSYLKAATAGSASTGSSACTNDSEGL